MRSGSHGLGWLVALALTACGGGGSSAPQTSVQSERPGAADAPSASPSEPTRVTKVSPEHAPELPLPMSTRWVRVTARDIGLVEHGVYERVLTLDGRGGTGADAVSTLASALRSRARSDPPPPVLGLEPPPPVLGLEVAPETPYRTVLDAVRAAREAGTSSFELIVRLEGSLRAHRVAVRTAERLPSAPRGLDLALTLSRTGAILAGSGGRMGPGCEPTTTNAAPTFAGDDGAVDLAALRACLQQIDAVFPDEDLITVGAEPDVAFKHVARAMVAAAGEGYEWFPLAVLATP